jgi:hypothetical protein
MLIESLLVAAMIDCSLSLSVSVDVDSFARFKAGQPIHGETLQWLGADSAASIALSSGKAVWLWGDTLVGSISNASERLIVSMPRNSIAVAASPTAPQLDFYARINHSNVHDQHTGFFTPANQSNWLWLLTGFELQGELFLLGVEVTHASGLPGFDFAIVGSVVVRVSNPNDAPYTWQWTKTSIPNTGGSETWNSAASVDGQRIFVLGQTGQFGATRLGHLSASDVLRDDWSQITVVQGALLSSFGPPETSLTFLPKLKRWALFVVPFGTNSLQVVLSPSARLDDTAAWTVRTIWQIALPYGDYPKVFCYAPKAHPELSNSSSVFLTLCSNTPKIDDLINATDLYVPVPIRINV